MESLNDAQSSFPEIGPFAPYYFSVRLEDERCVSLWILDCVLFRIPMCIVLCVCVCFISVGVGMRVRALTWRCGAVGTACLSDRLPLIKIELNCRRRYLSNQTVMIGSFHLRSVFVCCNFVSPFNWKRTSFPFKCARCSTTRLRSQQGNTTFTELMNERWPHCKREIWNCGDWFVLGEICIRGLCFQVCSKKGTGAFLLGLRDKGCLPMADLK
jgi:hypothetical protein